MLDVIDSAVKKAFDALGDLPTVAAQKAHLDFLRDRFAHAERDIMKLQKENLDLLRALDGVKDKLSDAEKKLADLTFQTILADIGPCKVKVDIRKNILPGYYCPSCGASMLRGSASFGDDIARCLNCTKIYFQGSTLDAAKEDFIRRIRETSS